MRVLPRVPQPPETVYLRPRDPDDRREFEVLLPWLTPLLVYTESGRDWVRWSVPKQIGAKIGLENGCDCCDQQNVVLNGPNDDYLIDTAWNETSWWLDANGYTTPTKEEGITS